MRMTPRSGWRFSLLLLIACLHNRSTNGEEPGSVLQTKDMEYQDLEVAVTVEDLTPTATAPFDDSSMPSSLTLVRVGAEEAGLETQQTQFTILPSRRPSTSPSTSYAPSNSNSPMTLSSTISTPLPITSRQSSLPTVFPSFSPTDSCHDQAGYQSPINGLECSHHSGTDCIAWRHIGLDLLELKELVESCPISCDIPCG